jgi:hypothetical protein
MNMRDVAVYKASRIGEQEEVQSLRLTANAEVPEQRTLEMAAAIYDREGEEIASALAEHLPGGTVDAVLRHLLLLRASLLRVPFDGRRQRT